MSASECEERKSSMENVDPPSDQALQEANSHIKQAYEILKQESLRVQREKEAFDSVAKKLEHVHFDSTVTLNVGGQLFTTSLQTLTKDPGSMLHAMFSGRFDTKPRTDGSYFIDRDGTHFRYILNYLRTGKLVVPADVTVREELEVEGEFYQIRGLLEELQPKIVEENEEAFQESTILKQGHHEVLSSWLGPQEGSWSLLYRASSGPGWKSADFHSRCDDKGPTVTIVRSGDFIFGGFTEQSWKGLSGMYKTCNQAFLFSMVGPSGLGSTKLALNPGKNGKAILCNESYGPIFGEGGGNSLHDFLLSPTSSFSSLGTYQCPPGQDKTTFLAGANSFTLSAFEVFGLKK